MGADFTAAAVPYFQKTPERTEEFFRVVKEEVFKEDSDVAIECIVNAAGIDDHPIPLEVCYAARDALDWIDASYRCIATFRLPEMEYYLLVTGGMTHGDFPTEMMGDFVVLSSLGKRVWELMVKWAKEDFKTLEEKMTVAIKELEPII